MSTLVDVMIVAGGLSHERDVSLRSARRVHNALKEAGLSALIVDLDDQLLPHIAEHKPRVIWPLLHGAHGEDGALRSVLDLLSIPIVGSSANSCRLTWDKPLAKAALESAGVKTPRSIALPHGIFRELGAKEVIRAVTSTLGLPLVVKPARGGSSLGVSVINAADALPRAMVDCFAYDSVALVEERIHGTEIAVSVIDLGEGPEILPPVEIVPIGGAYDYDARYTAGATEFFCPARLDEKVAAACAEVALATHQTLGLSHLSRVDLIVDDHGTPWVLEANSAPGMTETSLYPQSVEASGHSLAGLYSALVESASSNHALIGAR